MKAIGAAAIANPASISQGMIWGSGIFSAVVWAVLALSGLVEWLHKITAKPVMRGIMLGLGVGFVLEGLKMMSGNWMLAVVGLIVTFFLLRSKRLPAMLVLLGLGVVASLVLDPSLVSQLKQISPQFRLPELVFGKFGWHDLLMGVLVLGLPQVPLTWGNAVLGTVAENNELFPDRQLRVKTLALNHGIINAISFVIGGIPVCHGAGGMAGHVRFGARTGGALVILGAILLLVGFFFSRSVVLLFNMIPAAILGVILFFAGVELASIVWDIGSRKEDIYVLLVTAGLAIINMGIAFLAGLTLYYALERKLIKV
jgi:MFS superfamily sulfate permease-like transporter